MHLVLLTLCRKAVVASAAAPWPPLLCTQGSTYIFCAWHLQPMDPVHPSLLEDAPMHMQGCCLGARLRLGFAGGSRSPIPVKRLLGDVRSPSHQPDTLGHVQREAPGCITHM